MLLRLLLIASAFTTLSLMGNTFWSPMVQATGSDTLDPVASCAPTPPDEASEDDEKPRRPGGGRFS